MSGHNKWSTIKQKKGKNDAARAKVFTKIGRELIVAIKDGGSADPSVNSKLKDCIAKAKAANVPNDNIERIIKKASSDADSTNYEAVTYEGYGPNGVAVIVEALTDNRNRTAGEVRHYFDKFGGNMGTQGCVSFMFSKKGVLVIEREDLEKDEDTVMSDALECGASDFEADDDVFTIYTETDDFGAVRDELEKLGYTKETDWMEYRITIPDELPERYYKYADIVIAKNKLNVRKVTRRMVNKENYGRKFFKLINETYYKLYGFSLLSDKQIDAYTKLYLGLLDTRMVSFIENENGELVAAGVTMPDLTAALQKCGGKLFPFGWFHLLKAIFWKPCDTLDMLLVGVREDYRGKGLNAVLVTDLYPRLKAMGFKYAETTAELETNDSIQAMWKYFEREQHKRRRVYAKKIE